MLKVQGNVPLLLRNEGQLDFEPLGLGILPGDWPRKGEIPPHSSFLKKHFVGDLTLLLSAGALELLNCLREWSWCKHHIGPKQPSEMHCISEIWDLMVRKHHEEPGAKKGVFPPFYAPPLDVR